MQRIFAGLLLVLACHETVPEAKIDPTTGLWFPPYASRNDYLKRNPAHPYNADLSRAFVEYPALEHEVCAAIQNTPAPPEGDDSVRQLRTMLEIQCMAAHPGGRKRWEEAQMEKRPDDELMSMFEAEEASVANVPPGARRQAAFDLFGAIRTGDRNALSAAFRAIALDPSYDQSAYELLLLPSAGSYPSKRIAAFVMRLYEARATSDRPDAAAWKQGRPAVLFFAGRWEEARAAAEAVGLHTIPAVVDRMNGHAGTLEARQRENCPNNDCIEYAAYAVRAALEIQKENAPHSLVAVANDVIRLAPDNWPVRMTLLGDLGIIDPSGTRARLHDVLADRDAPEGAMIDAVYYLAKMAATNDPAHAAPLFDCWLSLHHLAIPPLSPDPWGKLAAMEESRARPSADCFGPGASNVDSQCAVHVLQVRFQSAVDGKQWDVARQSVEQMLAVVLTSHAAPSLVRDELVNLASAESESGIKDEPALILGYLADQPHDSYVAYRLGLPASVKTPHAQRPWIAPAALDPAHRSAPCPPARLTSG